MSRYGVLVALVLPLAGCRQDMFQQPKYRALERSEFFADGRSARPVPADTVEFGQPDLPAAQEAGTVNGIFSATIPVPVDEALLRRGQDRYDVFCSPCHARVGDGQGMIAKRGFIQPANLHSDRVRNAPPGYLYAVIANGYGAMPDYGRELNVHDRWAIVAYIRALELSRRANIADVPPAQRSALENQK